MILRPLIVIPTYNNRNSINDVAKSIRELYNIKILIIDDGSVVPVEDIVEYIEDVTILRNQENKGKGYSIRRAFKYALENDYTHVITIDGDGQHKAIDINSFLEQIKLTPFSMIIGKRKLDIENVPQSSKFGKKFSNFWVKYQTDKVIEDSQSGFRCYPIFHVQNMKFFTSKYDFEIEVLVRLLWKKVEVVEIKTDVYYPPPKERVSHFNKLWDNVRISTLNTFLVILSLLQSNLNGHKKALSLSFGVFWAVQPIYGLQVFFIALTSFILKLNFTLMFVSSQISIPPMIPVWTYISLILGSYITGTPLPHSFEQINLDYAAHSLLSWVLGSFLLGIILASLIMVSYFFSIIFKKKETKKLWDGKDRGGKIGNRILEIIISTAGQKLAYFLLFFICPYFYIFARTAAKAQDEYLKLLYPNKSFFQRQFEVIKVFYVLGKTLIDNKLVKYRNIEYFKVNRTGNENLTSNGLGHIIISAHTGGWLLASKLFPEDSYQLNEKLNLRSRINIVEFDAGEGHSSGDKIAQGNINFIGSNDSSAIFKISKALDDGETVVFMTDRVISKTTEQLTFIGAQSFFDKTPFKIAHIKKVPISFAFAFKKSDREYDLFITPRKYYEENTQKNKDQEIKEMMDFFLSSLEEKLRLYPYQWFNFFKFWSTVPLPLTDTPINKRDHIIV